MPKSWFFKKTNKIYETLPGLRKKREDTKTRAEIREETFTTDLTEIKKKRLYKRII